MLKILQAIQLIKINGEKKKKETLKITTLTHTHTHTHTHILQARLQQYVNFQMFKLDLDMAEEPEIKMQIIEKAREFPLLISALLITQKLLTVSIITNCGKF